MTCEIGLGVVSLNSLLNAAGLPNPFVSKADFVPVITEDEDCSTPNVAPSGRGTYF
jgi:hypothetical protein